MTIPAILVDTNILWKSSLRNKLTDKIEAGKLQVYVPTLMHAERIRQIAAEKGENFVIDFIRQAVKASKFQLLPFEVQDAEAIADVWLELNRNNQTKAYWKKHRLDILLHAIIYARNYPLATDDTGKHLETAAGLMNSTDLQTWLETL